LQLTFVVESSYAFVDVEGVYGVQEVSCGRFLRVALERISREDGFGRFRGHGEDVLALQSVEESMRLFGNPKGDASRTVIVEIPDRRFRLSPGSYVEIVEIRACRFRV
jgi:hypothetical protein